MSLQDTEAFYETVQTVNESYKVMTFRKMQQLSGAVPALNPVSGFISISTPTTVGSTSLTLNAPTGSWFLEIGDVLTFGSTVGYTVQARNTASLGKFTGVQVQPAVTTTSSSGTPVAVTALNDYPVRGAIYTYPTLLIDGTLVTMTDVRAMILTTGTDGRSIPVPKPADHLFIDGLSRTVGVVTPHYSGSTVTVIELQAKA